MVALTNTEIFALVLVVILAIVVIALMLYLLRRLRNRRRSLLNELSERPEASQDRAFNRIAMARREAEILNRQGTDIRRAQEQIAEAQAAFDLRHYDRAYEVAQSAHESLVNARQMGARLASAPSAAAPTSPSPTRPLPASSSPQPAAAAPTPSPIPKNRAESQFQIRLLGEELAGLPSRREKDPVVVEAKGLHRDANAAFELENYTEAFRLALRGRRALGGTIESLPATGAAAAAPIKPTANAGDDAESAAETVAGAERCPDCGYPALPGDSFCRGCGRPRAATQCATCGAPRAADEPFCGRCGARFT